MSGPQADAFAALLGIDVERRSAGHTWPSSRRTSGTPTRTAPCTVPSSTRWPAPRWPLRPMTTSTRDHLVGPGRVPPARRAGRPALRRGGPRGLDRPRGHLHRDGAPRPRGRSAGLGAGPRHAPDPARLSQVSVRTRTRGNPARVHPPNEPRRALSRRGKRGPGGTEPTKRSPRDGAVAESVEPGH